MIVLDVLILTVLFETYLIKFKRIAIKKTLHLLIAFVFGISILKFVFMALVLNNTLPVCNFNLNYECENLTIKEEIVSNLGTKNFSLLYPVWGLYTNTVSYYRTHVNSDAGDNVRLENASTICKRIGRCGRYMSELINRKNYDEFLSFSRDLYIKQKGGKYKCEYVGEVDDFIDKAYGRDYNGRLKYKEEIFLNLYRDCIVAYRKLAVIYFQTGDYKKIKEFWYSTENIHQSARILFLRDFTTQALWTKDDEARVELLSIIKTSCKKYISDPKWKKACSEEQSRLNKKSM